MRIPEVSDLPRTDPRHHAVNISRSLKDLAEHAREDVDKVADDRARMLFEVTSEVLLGLANAHDSFVGGPSGDLIPRD